MKERVTLTIEEDLLTQVDETINNESIKNRSHAVEMLLRKALRGKVPTTAVILAGGKNSQAMKPIQTKPLLEHNINLLQKYGITDIIIVGGNFKEVLTYFGRGEKLSVKLSYIEEEKPLGTAGCLYLLRERLTTPFIMLNGDDLKNVNITKLFAAHNQYKGVITIALTPVLDPKGYGVAELDGFHIVRFEEKGKEQTSTLINAGVYIMEPEVTHSITQGVSTLEESVFPKLAREGKLFGYPFSGQWLRTQTAQDLARAEKEWKGI